MKLLLKYLFWAGIITCFIGPVVGVRAFGLQLFALRLISMLALPFMLLNPTHQTKGVRRFASRLLILMLIYGIASLIWSPDPQLGSRFVGVLFMGVIFFLLVARHAIDRSVLSKIMIIWSIMIIGISLLGIYEIVTEKYLFTFAEDGGEYNDLIERVRSSVGWICPRVFWQSRNNFAFVNAISALVLMGWVFEARGVYRIFATIATLLAIAMVMYAYSRAAVFGLMIGLLFFIFICTLKINSFYRIVAILMMIGIGIFLFYKGEELIYGSKMLLALEAKAETADNEMRRFYYNTAVIQGTTESFGFGRGLGASTEIINGGSYHHYLLETLAELGLWILLGYLLLMAKVCFQLWSAIRQGRNVFWSCGLLASCIAFPVLCAGPATVIDEGPYWLWLAFLVAFTEYDAVVMRLNKKQLLTGLTSGLLIRK